MERDANLSPASSDRAVTAEAVTWAFRLFIGREPRDAAEIAIHEPHVSLRNLSIAFAESAEFRVFFETIVKKRKLAFALPTFMFHPPADALPWQFGPPTLENPISQLCTAAQFSEAAFAEIAGAMTLAPRLHRSNWETVWIVSVLAGHGCVAPGKRALGLGVRRERIAALLASRAVSVHAIRLAETAEPNLSQQHAMLQLFYPGIIPIDDFDVMVSMEDGVALDPARGLAAEYDGVWSMGVVQRLGSIAAAGDFIRRSLDALRPGGVAAHTLDLNLSSEADGSGVAGQLAFHRADLDALVLRLVRDGYEVLPINLYPGHDAADAVIDAPPFGLPHLKVLAGLETVGSFGLAIRRPA
jgi:hypothetical protein